MDFTGKIVVVTGAASGIGREAAMLLGQQGGTIVVADFQKDKAREAVRELESQGISAKYIKTDLTDMSQIRSLFSETIATYETIDILLNCAGIGPLTKIPDVTPEEWDLVLSVNLKAVFFCSQEALKYMCPKHSGKIIHLASVAGKMGGVLVGAHYAASKAGVICLTKSLALYAAPFNITVNSVCPGPTVTPLTDAWGDELNTSLADKIPLKRYATPTEVAEAICFLASEQADYITGEILDVNGGFVMD
jgi:NAD(P)-dependent dehydrogenase (short-subunit alcohol dehydrogenase family)